MTACLVVQPIHRAGIELLEASGIRAIHPASADPETVIAAISPASSVITRNAGLSAAAIAAAPLLRVIAVHGVGTDPVAVDAATARGIAVVNTPGANVTSVAEHAIGLTFALAKAAVAADAAVRSGDQGFKYAARLVELAGRSFGVVGFGAIGQATARLARALGMRVLGWSRSAGDDLFAAQGVERLRDLDALLAQSDVVSLHLPLTAETRGIIDARRLALMQPGAFLVNTARGALVDEAALAAALERGAIAGAGLDVFAAEPLPPASCLQGLRNVVLSPHVAGSSAEALERTALDAARQVAAVLEGKRPSHLVNPEVWPLGETAPRRSL